MKAATLYQFDESLERSQWLAYEDVPEPVIEKPTDVIVRIGGAGVCGTDLQLIKGYWCDFLRIELPLILGHENAGWVEEIGPAVESVKVGDPVIIHPMGAGENISTGSSFRPRDEERGFYPGFNRNGGFAEYMLAEEHMLVLLPTHFSPMESAPLADAGLTAYHVASRASKHLKPGHYTLVLGAGGLGHVGIQVLRALSTAEIIVVDKSEAAIDLARTVGAHYTFMADEYYTQKILALTGGRGVETVIDFVGIDSTVKCGLSITRKGGHYYLVGCGGQLTISTLEMIQSEKTIVGILGGTISELRELMTLADRGLVTLATKEYPLSRANSALRDLKNGKNSGRAVLVP
jgi:NAD+-dependent secondary alcohol dehydrogenase Adh1